MDVILKEVIPLGDKIQKYYSIIQTNIKKNLTLPEELIIEYHINKDACLVLIPKTEKVFYFFDTSFVEHPEYDINLDKKVFKEALNTNYIKVLTECEDYPDLL